MNLEEFYGDNGPWRGSKGAQQRAAAPQQAQANKSGYNDYAQRGPIGLIVDFFGALSILSAWIVDPLFDTRMKMSDKATVLNVDRNMGAEVQAILKESKDEKGKSIESSWFGARWPFPCKIGIRAEDKDRAVEVLEKKGIRIHYVKDGSVPGRLFRDAGQVTTITNGVVTKKERRGLWD